jgi:hypothetical protein
MKINKVALVMDKNDKIDDKRLMYLSLTLSENYGTHSYRFLVSTATSLIVSTLLLVIRTKLKVERT